MHSTAHTLPPVTEAHCHAAFESLRFKDTSYAQAIASPTMRRIIEVRAASLRTDEYKRSHARTVVPVRRVRLGLDGHPIGWCTQLVGSNFDVTPDLIGTP